MNIGLIIGKANSQGLPGKNTMKILGRPSVEYAFIAAKYSKIDILYVSTDSTEIIKIARRYKAKIIERPEYLARPDSLTEDVLEHSYEIIKKDLNSIKIESISLLFANTPTVSVPHLNQAIDYIKKNNSVDSVFSIVNYDMFSPFRARKIDSENLIYPFINIHDSESNSIRGSGGSTYFCDLSIQVLNERCLSDLESGLLPFRWQGKFSVGIEVDFGFDIDSEWQVPVVEYWLKKNGFTRFRVPWKLNKKRSK
jgi:CMP-N-acetylneuraminic acid synthetase